VAPSGLEDLVPLPHPVVTDDAVLEEGVKGLFCVEVAGGRVGRFTCGFG
jgi:hypothetical protein